MLFYFIVVVVNFIIIIVVTVIIVVIVIVIIVVIVIAIVIIVVIVIIIVILDDCVCKKNMYSVVITSFLSSLNLTKYMWITCTPYRIVMHIQIRKYKIIVMSEKNNGI